MDKFKALAFLLVASALLLSILVSLTYTVPIGADIHFHYDVARVWARGENGMMSDIVFKFNLVPYPPLFHLLLVPAIWLRCEFTFARVLQAFMYPLAIGMSTWFMWKHRGKESAIYCAMLMMSSVALIDGAFQVKPQSLEIVLLPLAVHYFLEEKKLHFLALSSIFFYTHGLASAAVLGGLLIYALHQRWFKTLGWTAGLSLPVMVPSLAFIPQALTKWGPATDTPQERGFWACPPIFLLWYIGPLLFSLPIVAYRLAKWRETTRLDKATVLTFLTMLVMLPVWADRTWQYATVPLAWLTAGWIQQSRYRTAILPFLAFMFMFYASLPWLWLIQRNFYVLETWTGQHF